MGEFETLLKTRDEVEGLHNCREFSQPLECLYQDMQVVIIGCFVSHSLGTFSRHFSDYSCHLTPNFNDGN